MLFWSQKQIFATAEKKSPVIYTALVMVTMMMYFNQFCTIFRSEFYVIPESHL